jgi:hypothetical protein
MYLKKLKRLIFKKKVKTTNNLGLREHKLRMLFLTSKLVNADSNLSACSFGLSATSQQYFSLTTNQPPVISQQYFSLRTNQHQPSATSQTNRLDASD